MAKDEFSFFALSSLISEGGENYSTLYFFSRKAREKFPSQIVKCDVAENWVGEEDSLYRLDFPRD